MTTTTVNTSKLEETVQVVPSYLRGQWVTPEDVSDAAQVRDAATGEVVCHFSAKGLDIASAVNYARDVGAKNLQKYTLHERAMMIKEMGLYLKKHRDKLNALAHKTGANKQDNFVDVDGGITTALVISSKARKELPNSQVIVDAAEPEVLSADGSFLGTHIFVPQQGIAVQINAFNFPVWGMLEKFAPAFIAGIPTIVKPGTPSGYVTQACVKFMVESGILPEGAIQLISGSARDLLDYLDYRDQVAFTGSAATAQKLRAHRNVAENGVQFSSEADSLNAAILGADVSPEDPEFAIFIKAVFAEMTAKAGQKCTAIRRVLVPNHLKETVAQALRERLAEKVVVGDPRDDNATMGPLVSVEQRADVAAAVSRLAAAGGQLVCGGPDELDGAYFAPTVFTFDNPYASAVHEVEAFGPVVSIVGYSDTMEAIELAARGRGSLVASVITHDPEIAAEFARGIGAHHGRLHFLDRDDAKTSTGHGSPLPNLIHGGPGRAGGGEELGGVRSIKHHMQRVAIQGTPDHLTAITGIWHRGAQANTVSREDVETGRGVHPFRKSIAELEIGDQFVSDFREVRLEDIIAFADFTGDQFYAHTDAKAAAANPFFPSQVAHGYLLVSWAAGLFVEPAPGPVLANIGLENLKFVTPVPAGTSIQVVLTCKQIKPRETEIYGDVYWDAQLLNQDGELCASYDVLTGVEKEHTTFVDWSD